MSTIEKEIGDWRVQRQILTDRTEMLHERLNCALDWHMKRVSRLQGVVESVYAHNLVTDAELAAVMPLIKEWQESES